MAVFLFGRSEPFSVAPTFADNSWADIVKACQMNKVPASWAVGDYKTMTIGGTAYRVDIIGKNHDSYADGTGKAPLTLQLHDCYKTEYGMNEEPLDVISWTTCDMRTTILPSLLRLMPSEVQAGVREVNKRTCRSSEDERLTTTADKLFFPSEYEIFGVVSQSLAAEGTQYAYYRTAVNRRKKMNNDVALWWNRSPSIDSTSFCRIDTEGYSDFYPAEVAFSISFAFCF